MKYTLIETRKFQKDVKRCLKRGYPMLELKKVLRFLEETGTVPTSYRPHKLFGIYDGYWECHIKPDWLLIWKIIEGELVLLLMGTGTHSDLL